MLYYIYLLTNPILWTDRIWVTPFSFLGISYNARNEQVFNKGLSVDDRNPWCFWKTFHESHSLVTNPTLPSCPTLRSSITDLTSLPANWVLLLQNISNVQGSKTSTFLPLRYHECWPCVILFKFWFLEIYKYLRCSRKLFNPVVFLLPLRQPLSCYICKFHFYFLYKWSHNRSLIGLWGLSKIKYIMGPITS